MAKNIQNKINIDKSNDVIAEWHDESHLNYFMIKNTKLFKFLIPDYCYPENYYEKIPGEPKILALDKKHHSIRNIFSKKIILVNTVGGLGNLLFQLFYAYNIAFRFNLNVAIGTNKVDELRETPFYYYLFDNILRVDTSNIDDFYIVKEDKKHFEDLMLNIPMNTNIYLTGYFQSSYYFDDNFDRIKEHFNLEIQEIAKKIFKKFNINNKKLISFHVRGSDYINNDYHLLLDESYYINCLKEIDLNDSYVILFTDDIKYASKFNNYIDINIIDIIDSYIEDKYKYLRNNPELSFFLMSLCDNIICANSTYSLWASYFSNAKKIFLPNKWFGNSGPNDFNINELILNNNFKIIDF